MSLRFFFGPSGSGKSRQLYEEIIGRAQESLDRGERRNFLVVVPDQFTMQTQKDLVELSDRGGILNIDVLSFGRLSHRILEEVGGGEIPVLDDTGKSLVLQKVAAGLKEELPALGGLLHRQGYIHEVKSAISEFMQYGIGVEDVDRLIECAGGRGALVHRLKDLQTLYRGFLDYIKGNFITTEETLEVVRRSLHKSALLPGSVVVFDGFTGFTPIQNRLIQELMCLCAEVIVTVTMGEGEDPYRPDGEQKLFYLSKKTVADLEKLADEAKVSRGQDVFIPGGARFRGAPALLHLERNLFRYQSEEFAGPQDQLRVFEVLTPREEVHQTALYIRELVQREGMSYRDIAVITGNLESYAPYVEQEFGSLSIPCFLDRTRGIVLNPMTEVISAVLELWQKDFSYESVFRYLRTGMSGICREDVDLLENYILQTGIRGYRRWSGIFTHKTADMGEDEGPLQHLNQVRSDFLGQVEMLRGKDRRLASEYVECLYEFLVQNRIQQRLSEYEEYFAEQGEPARAKEYGQIYRLVLDLLDQIHQLLGEEEISLREFGEILEAGFGEIQVGTIPQNVDRVLVGDMERTRLKQVKALFFLGVNDGNIPQNTAKGGIISDMDRELLCRSGLELAPSPRQQMYIQRLYLYLNMTKPSQRLYLSFSGIDSGGKSVRPAYLIETVKKLFPGLETEYPEHRSISEQIVSPQSGVRYLAQQLREYAQGNLKKEEMQEFFTIYSAYGGEEICSKLRERRSLLTDAAFRRYRDSGLSAAVARALYGWRLENSVSRLETYAACAYRHFLQYGLGLREREEFGFESVDMGNVYHGVLERFAVQLEEKGYTWFDFPESFAKEAVGSALEAFAATYGATVLYSSARREYALARMGRVLTRTVLTLSEHLKRGVFLPEKYEMSFRFTEDLESIHVSLSEQEKMHLRGRIDRIDVAEDEDRVYVKVIDYKSGGRQFDLAALYYGLQLQLVVYMNAAMELEARKHPDKEVVPAALLYYHIDDPTVESPVELSDEALDRQILGMLRMNGVVNAEPGVAERLDRYLQDKSDVIPVEKKKDGSYSARSSVLDTEDLKAVSAYVNRKVKDIGREILDGNIALNPYEKGKTEACTYCAYSKVCGFDPHIPGYEKRKLENLNREEALEQIREEADAEETRE